MKERLFITFHPQTDGQTERQNSKIEVYLRAFVNYKQDNSARLLPMAEFAFNNTKHASMRYTPFELNYEYHPRIFYEEDIDFNSRSKAADELSKKLMNFIVTYRKNLQHTQELEKRAHDKKIKPRSYASGEKIWLNNKYIKTKRNQKIEAKFFRLFQVFHQAGNQAYKLKLPKQ